MNLAYLAIAAFGYLIGSIPFGLVLGKVFKVGDIRSIGSGNIGATNALRTGNKKFALAVLLGDGLKGALAVLLAWQIPVSFYADPQQLNSFPFVSTGALIIGLFAVVGHIFPVWLKFKGGKGVATGLGVIAALHWPAGLLCIAIWLITAKLSRYSSLGAIMAAINAPLYALATGGEEFALPFAFLGLLLLWTHRENIKRLAKGEESVIKLKKENV